MECILFVFAAHEEQETLVKTIAEDISVISDLSDVKYYFGPESAVYVFKTRKEFESVKVFFKDMMKGMNISYFLVEYDKEKMDFFLPPEAKEHLFDSDDFMTKLTKEEEDELENNIFREINSDGFKLFCDKLEEEDFEDNEIDLLRNCYREREPSLNDLLDKINLKGLNSLTKKDKELLNKYSK